MIGAKLVGGWGVGGREEVERWRGLREEVEPRGGEAECGGGFEAPLGRKLVEAWGEGDLIPRASRGVGRL